MALHRLGTLLAICAVASGCGVPHPAGMEAGRNKGRIVYVIDGDTVKVDVGRRAVDVRLLGIDTPEKFATRFGVGDECGAAAASELMRRFTGARVLLTRDSSQASVDRFGRLLRYVRLANGTDLGALAIRRGLAAPYVFRHPSLRIVRYRVLAEAARDEQRGSWRLCGGDFHSGVPGVQNGFEEGDAHET